MVHYFYEIRNNLNGKIYRGIHSTNNLNDGYLGSGTGIKKAVAKYGSENFTKTILKVFPTREEAAKYEESEITQEFIDRADTYNQITGGEKHQILGSRLSKEAKEKISRSKIGKKRSDEANFKNSEARKNERWVHKVETGEVRKIHKDLLEEYLQSGWKRGMGHVRSEEFKDKVRKAHTGKRLSEEHKKAISIGNLGKHNSQEHNRKIGIARKGRKFVFKEGQRLFIPIEELPNYLNTGWSLGR